MTKEERVQKLMKTLSLSREEAIELDNYDEAVNHNQKTEYDLTPEQEKVARKMARVENNAKHKNTVRTRKPNEIKESIIQELSDFLTENTHAQDYEKVTIENKSRKIIFSIGENDYELTLIEKRKGKK